VTDTILHTPGSTGNGKAPESPAWEGPIPLGVDYAVSAFPLDCLPDWLGDWAAAEAEATQTPPDLAALLVLAQAGAALAKKVRVVPRTGWSEPTNLFVVVALPSGERKSAVFRHALAPALAFEAEERARLAPEIAEKASEQRVLEKKQQRLEDRAAKCSDPGELEAVRAELKEVARELARHVVPDEPQIVCDDVTPEKLSSLLDRQGGRMLQASAEGTAFEIAKGRYGERPNFDVYLKGHAGDRLNSGRIGRRGETVERPALSVALAVQPDVVHGLAEHATMKRRGFLARFLYGLPASKVGRRKVAAAPVPGHVAERFHACMLGLWHQPGGLDERGHPCPQRLPFAPAADHLLRAFERWLEPQLAEGEELSLLAGWANKLAGACARLAAILHAADAVGRDTPLLTPINEETVHHAIRVGKGYFLPHALAAFALMGAAEDEVVVRARHVVHWLGGGFECFECFEGGGRPPHSRVRVVSKRDIHQANRSVFPRVEDMDPVLNLLVQHNFLRYVGQEAKAQGGGRPSVRFLVNPAVGVKSRAGVAPQNTQNTQNPPPGDPDSDEWEEGRE
jgi:replicative DNA helicase